MITCLLPGANLAVDTGGGEAGFEVGADKEVVDTETRVPAKGIAEVVPESIDGLGRMEIADSIGPALGDEGMEGRSGFRTEKGVVDPAFGFVDVLLGGHHVIVAGEDNGFAAPEERGRVYR